MTALSVNLNKIALLRNARGRDYPNIAVFAKKILDAGANGLTIHPRPDQRHATYPDILTLKPICDDYNVELNVEGYPTKELVSLAISAKVDQFTLVPDKPDQLTSDHGWDIAKNKSFLLDVLMMFKEAGIRTSLFMDTDLDNIVLAKEVGADRIELHTEPYARSFEKGDESLGIKPFIEAYNQAVGCRLGVNAGHDLDLNNLSFFLKHLDVLEVSIGHALTIEALDLGVVETVGRYLSICKPKT